MGFQIANEVIDGFIIHTAGSDVVVIAVVDKAGEPIAPTLGIQAVIAPLPGEAQGEIVINTIPRVLENPQCRYETGTDVLPALARDACPDVVGFIQP
ncbi:MAG: hypothetical protein JAY91_06055, partial [Candidatus Thiodiazotropha endolucinida]|nr:hypothetical protein [Candidatus Thiodiazotropha taylori]